MNTVSASPFAAGGGSRRLLAHRLATYDAAQAKAAGPHFEAQWRAHHTGRVVAAAPKPMSQPARAVPMPTASAVPASKPVPTAADLAVLEGQRRLRIAAQAASQKAAVAKAAEQRRAEIAASWDDVHAGLRDPFGHRAAEDPSANHGWGAIHAEIQSRRAQ